METKNVLLQRGEYSGKYVALKSFEDNTVVAHGTIPKEVMGEAASKGYGDTPRPWLSISELAILRTI